jgi:hypothetical protein
MKSRDRQILLTNAPVQSALSLKGHMQISRQLESENRHDADKLLFYKYALTGRGQHDYLQV